MIVACFLDRNPLGTALARALLEVPGPVRRLPFALLPRPEPVDATIRAHGVETTRLAFPPLTLLDASDRAVGYFEVEAVVDGDDLLRRWVDAVDGDMDVPVMGVAVKRIDRLVLPEAHLGEEHPHGLVRLGARRLLTLSPA